MFHLVSHGEIKRTGAGVLFARDEHGHGFVGERDLHVGPRAVAPGERFDHAVAANCNAADEIDFGETLNPAPGTGMGAAYREGTGGLGVIVHMLCGRRIDPDADGAKPPLTNLLERTQIIAAGQQHGSA